MRQSLGIAVVDVGMQTPMMTWRGLHGVPRWRALHLGLVRAAKAFALYSLFGCSITKKLAHHTDERIYIIEGLNPEKSKMTVVGGKDSETSSR